MATKLPEPARVDELTKAINKLVKAQDAAKAMDKARAAMGLMTNEAKRAAAAQDKLDKSNRKLAESADRVAKATEKAAKKKEEALAKEAEAQKKATDAAVMAGLRFSARVAEQKRSAEASDHATQASENAASSAAAEAATIGVVEAVAAAAAVAVMALAVATAKLAEKAIEVIEQREEWLALFTALGKGPGAGEKTLKMLDELQSELPFAQAKLVDWAKSLQSAGFQGDALKTAIKAVANATAIMGESGGQAAQKLLKQLAEGGSGAAKMVKTLSEGGAKSNKLLADMGLRTEDVTAALRAMGVKGKASADQWGMAIEKALAKKGKGPLENMQDDMATMVLKLREGFFSLFEGLTGPVNGFKGSVKDLFGQFSKGSPIMKALKPIVTEVFGALFKYASMAVQAISKFIKENVTAKSVGKTWHDIKAAVSNVASVLVKVWSFLKPIVTSSVFINGLVTMFKVLAVVLAVVVGTMGAMFVTMTVIAGAVVAVGTALWALIGQLLELGTAIVEGVINFDYSAFVSKMTAMAEEGLKAFKSVFSFGSPSKVMKQLGGHIGKGAEQGTEQSTGDAVSSARRLGTGMLRGAAAGMSSKGGAAGAKSITIEAGAIVIHAGGATITEEGLASILERLLATQGI